MKVAASYILVLSFIIGCLKTEAFIGRQSVVPPALFTNKIVATNPKHARDTALGLLDGSKANKIPAMKARQDARVSPLWDNDIQGLTNLGCNLIPVAVLAALIFNTNNTERESRKDAIAAQDKAFGVWRETQEKAIAAERETQEKAIAALEKAIVVEMESRKVAIAAQEKVIAAQEKNLRNSLLEQNTIWSLRFENFLVKSENVKKNDGMPPPSSPSDSKST